MTHSKRLGIIGAGKIGTAIARAAVAAGYDVAISGSGPADRIALTVDVLAPGARATVTEEVVRRADLLILTVPTHHFRKLPRDLFTGKIVVDAMNYWEPIDGDDPELAAAPYGSSPVVQEHFRSARVVKSLNQLGYHEFEENRRGPGSLDRVAVAAAGDDPEAVARVLQLIEHLGFDAIDAGDLDAGIALGPDGAAFGVAYNADQLTGLLWPENSSNAERSNERTDRGATVRTGLDRADLKKLASGAAP
jgi:predicted dinucleotide-binding enzyme